MTKIFFWEQFAKLIIFGLIAQVTVATALRLNETKQIVLTRTMRATPRLKRQECNVSKDKLIQLKNDIKNTFLNNGATSSDNNCVINIYQNTENCEELIKIIQCGVQHFKNEFSRTSSNSTSVNEVMQQKNSYNTFQQMSIKIMDHIKKSNNQQYQQEIDTLETQLQDMKNKINNLEYDLQEKNTRLCISEISSGKIDNAVALYKSNLIISNNASLLPNIVRIAYNEYGNLDNVKNIIQFMGNLKTCANYKLTFSILFNLMKTNNHLNDPEVFRLSKAQNACTPDSSIKNELNKHTSEVISIWANNIRNNDFAKINELISKDCALYLNGYWYQIIEKTYAKNLANAEIILNFIRSLPCIENTARALDALYLQMRSNNHLDSYQLIMLAYKLKHELNFANKYSMSEYKEKYEALKNKLPSSIRSLIWNGNQCVIKNKKWDEYLYAENKLDSENRRFVFTWIPKERVMQGYWIFTPENNAKHFVIKNTVHNEYLYPSSIFYEKTYVTFVPLLFLMPIMHGNSFRRVNTWVPGNKVIQGDWLIQPYDGAKFFILRNSHYNEYLVSAREERNYRLYKEFLPDNDRRDVTTAEAERPYDNNDMLWYIYC